MKTHSGQATQLIAQEPEKLLFDAQAVEREVLFRQGWMRRIQRTSATELAVTIATYGIPMQVWAGSDSQAALAHYAIATNPRSNKHKHDMLRKDGALIQETRRLHDELKPMYTHSTAKVKARF